MTALMPIFLLLFTHLYVGLAVTNKLYKITYPVKANLQLRTCMGN